MRLRKRQRPTIAGWTIPTDHPRYGDGRPVFCGDVVSVDHEALNDWLDPGGSYPDPLWQPYKSDPEGFVTLVHTDEITVVLGEGYEDQLDVSWLTWRDR